MTSRKRPINDENAPVTPRNHNSFIFFDPSAPKKPRFSAKKARPFTSEDRVNYEKQRANDRAREEEEKRQQVLADEKLEIEAAARRVEDLWAHARTLGFSTMHQMFTEILTTRHPIRSSQVSKTILNHGTQYFDLMRNLHPK
ncbi:hypothetical protein H0H92_014218, partial [Tricholoma furcatifolium]